MTTAIAAARSLLAYLLILAYIAVAGPLGLFAAAVLRWKSGLYALESGRLYFVQLWDSPDRELTLMIRRLPGR